MGLKRLAALMLALALMGLWAVAESPFAQDVVVDQMYSVDDYAVTEGLPDAWVNLLLLGQDTRQGNQYGNTDTIIILSMNMATRQAKLTSLMRDIWVTMDGRSKSGKLNSACLQGGPSLAMRTINECFGLNIQYYALVDLSGMAEIIDLLGGLELDITLEELTAINQGLFDLSPLSGMEKLTEYGSYVHLNGNQAVAYARIRKIDSDFKRVERQRYVLTEVARRIQREDPATIVGVVMKLLDRAETNMDLTQLMTIAKVGLEVDPNNIKQFRVPVEGTYESGNYPISDGSKVWSIRPDFAANTRLLHEFIYGE
ncbi:MAG: LCP family protein [Clostridia bacterium]|nr:LCP family protein [Clostridia bacterium]